MRGVLLCLAAISCQPADVETAVSWQFADGRSCASSGVFDVRLEREGEDEALQTSSCEQGLSPAQIFLQLPKGQTLLLRARSFERATLYQGRFTVDESVMETVTLFSSN